MPRITVYDTGRRMTTKFTLAFARGIVEHTNSIGGSWEVKHRSIDSYLEDGIPRDYRAGHDAIATLGILRGTGLLLKEAQQRGFDYYYMDHAYFNPGYSGKGWMRITKNDHACTTIRETTKDRWNGFHKHHGYALSPWRTNAERGDLILICPPTPAICWYYNLDQDWGERIEQHLKNTMPESEHYRIKIRHKPKEPVVDSQGNLVELREFAQQGDLKEDLANAHCVIAWNSMVALEATLAGIPVITGPHSACVRVSFDISLLENHPMPLEFNTEPPNRSAMLYWLANNQWKMKEIENGVAWRMLQENYS